MGIDLFRSFAGRGFSMPSVKLFLELSLPTIAALNFAGILAILAVLGLILASRKE